MGQTDGQSAAVSFKLLAAVRVFKYIDRAVQELPPELREVFLLRQDGVSFREIAEIQHCSINTSLARMRYALNKLRASLSGWSDTEEGMQ